MSSSNSSPTVVVLPDGTEVAVSSALDEQGRQVVQIEVAVSDTAGFGGVRLWTLD